MRLVNGLLLGSVLVLTACGPSEKERADMAAYQARLSACRTQLGQDPLVPIIGGGHLDTRRFDFNVPDVRVDDGQCGTDGFETSFYWTGEKILPAGSRFTGMELPDIPKHWRLMHVGARLGNRKFCKENPEKCKSTVPSPPVEWPEDATVHLKNYQLDVRMPAALVDHVRHLAFVLRDWPNREGGPRFLVCDIAQDVIKLSRQEIEDLDFGERTLPCQADFRHFDFKGGAARIRTGTEALREMPMALQALQTYLSNSVIREEQ